MMLGYHNIALLLRRIFFLFSSAVRKGFLSLQLVMFCKMASRVLCFVLLYWWRRRGVGWVGTNTQQPMGNTSNKSSAIFARCKLRPWVGLGQTHNNQWVIPATKARLFLPVASSAPIHYGCVYIAASVDSSILLLRLYDQSLCNSVFVPNQNVAPIASQPCGTLLVLLLGS